MKRIKKGCISDNEKIAEDLFASLTDKQLQ